MEQLATAIRLGVYPVGSTLPAERELAERLAVSRATLREAMAALRQAGLVETTRGRGGGTVVTPRARGTLRPQGRASHARSSVRTGTTRWSSVASSSRAPPRWPPRCASPSPTWTGSARPATW